MKEVKISFNPEKIQINKTFEEKCKLILVFLEIFDFDDFDDFDFDDCIFYLAPKLYAKLKLLKNALESGKIKPATKSVIVFASQL